MDELSPKRIDDIEQHLRKRGLDPDKIQVIMDKESNIATFLLYNLSGQLVGYQKYNPNGDKKIHNNGQLGKYFSYITKESDKSSKIAVWGVESISKDDPNLFVTEGIFDAVKLRNAGHPTVAVLTNNPKILRSWFMALNKRTIAILDNDVAGKKLGNLTDESYTVPKPFNDLGEMSQQEVNEFLIKIKHPPKKELHSQEISNTFREKQTIQKPQQPQDAQSKNAVIKKLLNSTVKNPETGNDILVKTALKYDKDHPSYKQAMRMTQAYAKKFGIKLRSR